MSLDGIAMRALAQDLKTKLSGGRIDKISQPSATTMTMGVRAGGHNHKCYATINPQSARVSLSRKSFESPQTPPQFCMVLRKHIQGAVIEDIRQVDWERMIAFDLRGRNEIGEETTFTLLFELMGKNSNIMLLGADGTILDAIKRVGMGTNNYRQFQPGIPYQMPPAQNKLALDALDETSLAEALLEQGLSKTASKALLSTIAGLGPQTVTELLVRANIAPDTRVEFLGEIDYHRLWQQCSGLLARCAGADWQPTLVYRGREIFAFAPFALEQFTAFHQETRPYMTTMLEDFYEIKEEQELFSQKRTSLERIVRHEKERCEKKLALQLEKVDELEHADSWRIKGELLTANLYRIKQGPSAEVENFYKDGAPLETIEMNPSKTPNENAQGYFKKYNKAKLPCRQSAPPKSWSICAPSKTASIRLRPQTISQTFASSWKKPATPSAMPNRAARKHSTSRSQPTFSSTATSSTSARTTTRTTTSPRRSAETPTSGSTPRTSTAPTSSSRPTEATTDSRLRSSKKPPSSPPGSPKRATAPRCPSMSPCAKTSTSHLAPSLVWSSTPISRPSTSPQKRRPSTPCSRKRRQANNVYHPPVRR